MRFYVSWYVHVESVHTSMCGLTIKGDFSVGNIRSHVSAGHLEKTTSTKPNNRELSNFQLSQVILSVTWHMLLIENEQNGPKYLHCSCHIQSNLSNTDTEETRRSVHISVGNILLEHHCCLTVVVWRGYFPTISNIPDIGTLLFVRKATTTHKGRIITLRAYVSIDQ